MKRLVLACFLALSCSAPLYGLDDTDESGRKIDPARGVVRQVMTRLPNPSLLDAHFTGPLEKEFVLYQWEPEVCNVDFMGWCVWRGSPLWRRVLAVSSPAGVATGAGVVDCRAWVVLTGWFRRDSSSAWVQATTSIVSNVPGDGKSNTPIGVIAGFEDGDGGKGTVEFIHGCNP